MKIYVAKNSGFCRGVKRAVELALSSAGENVYLLGDIIHNPIVSQKIARKGIVTVDSVSAVPNGATLIIRSHGEGEDIYREAEKRNIRIVDTTCSFVKRTQQIVKEHYDNGFAIVIVGHKTHPEVIGINGWCNNSAFITEDVSVDFPDFEGKKVCVVAQTTFSAEKYKKFIQNITTKVSKTVEIFSTICYTTNERQQEAETLSQKCDAMIVIGGLNSSNTDKLAEICKKHCKHVVRIASADSLNPINFINFETVGIVAGASTPDEQTQEVLLKMENTEVNNVMAEAMAEMDKAQRSLKKGDIIKVTISQATDDGLDVMIPSRKREVAIAKEELLCENYDKANYADKVGEEIEVMVLATNPDKLSEKAIQAVKEEEAVIEGIKQGNVFTVTCDGFNKGGLTAKIGTYSVFVPSSQIRIGFVKELEKYVGKTLRLKMITQEESRRKQIVASQRVILEAEKAERDAARAEKEAAFFGSINVDDIVEGEVVRFAQFGAFVDVNGFDCLAHISDLSWNNVHSPADVLEIGKKYNFKVIKIDQEAKKVSLGFKQLQQKPWELAAEKYPVGSVITGKVVRIVPFGAFVEVDKNIDGLVHISQISHDWLENPLAALTVGQDVDVKVLDLDVEKEKMTLSIKALLPEPEVRKTNPNRPQRQPKEEGEAPVRKPRAPKAPKEDDEVHEWKDEEGFGGASISELLNSNNK